MKTSHEQMVTKMKAQFDYLTAKMDAYLEGTKEC
jgi:uncharacterized coiled-coil protein SlyX